MWCINKISTFAIVLALLLGCLGFISPVSAYSGDSGNALPDRLLIKFKGGIYANAMAEVLQKDGGKFEGIIPGIGVQVFTVPHGQGAAKLAVYRHSQDVAYAEADSVAHIVDVPNDTYFNLQWGMTKVQAPQAWDITNGSSGASIAILDTGIDSNHPDLEGKIISSINFTSSPTAEANGQIHGTHVAGIAAALTNNGVGVAGLGRDCSLMNVKVLGDDGYGYYSWVAQGIIWAADNGAEVINLSLGGTATSSTLEDAINYAWGKGVVVVAAAGNNASTSPFYPAYYANCLSVGATDANDRLASFSDHGSWVDVAAPGTDIYSAVPGGAYGYLSGTSMASPEVAGLAGLLLSVTGDTNGDGKLNDDVKARIEANCDNVGIDVAFGRINAYKAVQGVSTPPTPSPTPTPTPTPAPPTIPSAPTLGSPGNGSVVSGTLITYKWNASTGATNYWITVSTNSNPSDTTKYKINGPVGNVLQYTKTGYPNDGTTYYWWVSAGNALGWSSQSQVAANGFSFINGVPKAPTLVSPKGTGVDGTSITYKWNAVPNATMYKITVSTSSNPSDSSNYKMSGLLGNVVQYTDTGYPNDGTTYYWWVSAGSSAGWSPASQGFTFNNGAPAAPTLVSPVNGTGVAGTSVTYKWKAAAGSTNYQLKVSTSSNPSDTSKINLTLGDVTTYTDTGYPNDATTYYWWVSAGNSAGWSPASQGFTFFSGAPSVPTLVSPGNGAVVSGTSITYKWNASAGATMYWLTVSTSSNLSDRSKFKFSGQLGNVVQYTNTGYPNNGATYYWWVSAGNGAGWASQSQVLANGYSFTNGVPKAPTLVSPKGTGVDGTSVTYKWNAVAYATNYQLEVSTSSNPSDPSKINLTLGNVTTYTDTGYSNDGTTYYWWVSAGNSAGWSPASQGTFNNGAPAAPTLVSPVNGTGVSGTSITYKWNASAGATMYRLTVSTSSNPSDPSKINLTLGDVTTYTDTGYPNDATTYYWWVSAGNSAGWSPVSKCFTFFSGAPSVPTLVSPGNGAVVSGTSITYKWNASAGATMYWLTVSTSSNLSDRSKFKFNGQLANVTQFTKSGYPNDGCTYYWWVSAGNGAGWSSQSQVLANGCNFTNGVGATAPSPAPTPESTSMPPTIPSAPTLVSPGNGAVVSGTSITYKWNASAGATKYYITVSTSSDPSDPSKYKLSGLLANVTQYTNTGYTNQGITYYWWVSAGNGLGWSAQSLVAANGHSFVNGSAPAPTSATSLTPTPTPTPVPIPIPAPTPTPSPAIPAAPTLLSPGNGAEVSGTSITYKWNASAGATKYYITVSTNPNPSDSSKWEISGLLGSVTQYTDTGYRNNGITYYWWVSAGNGLGWSAQSLVAANGYSFVNGSAPAPTPAPTPTPSPAIPAAPTLLSPGNGVVVSGTSITYKWNASTGATKYYITVSTSSDPSDTSKYKISGLLGNVVQYTNIGYPNNGATYYWWVSAGNSLGWSQQTDVLANGCNFVN